MVKCKACSADMEYYTVNWYDDDDNVLHSFTEDLCHKCLEVIEVDLVMTNKQPQLFED